MNNQVKEVESILKKLRVGLGLTESEVDFLEQVIKNSDNEEGW